MVQPHWIALCGLLSLVGPLSANVLCPDGWKELTVASTCINVPNNKKSWQAARNTCKSMGGDLIKVYNLKTMTRLSDKFNSTAKSYWIGLHDIDTQGDFRWLDDATKPDYTYWDVGQPTISQGSGKDCAQIDYTTDNQRWMVKPCGTKLNYICERPFVACPVGWRECQASGTCLKLHTDKKSWADAKVACHSELGDLVRVRNAEMTTFLTDELKAGKYRPAWIGLHYDEYDKVFQWPDGADWSKNKNLYKNWDKAPGTKLGNKKCVNIGATKGSGKWTNKDCKLEFEYVCERRAVTCPGGWMVGTTSGTCIRFRHSKRSWDDARKLCQYDGGDLVKIIDKDTNDVISDRINKQGDGRTWIGLHDKDQKGKFRWLDETEEPDFYYWKNDPNNLSSGDETQDCVEIGLLDDNKWNDDFCSKKAKFICEKSPVSCPTGWIGSVASGTCISFEHDKKSWSGAREACQSKSADLVKIVDDEMNSFVVDKINRNGKGRTWIGLHDPKKDGNYVWLNENTTPSFKNWADDQTSSNKYCAEIGANSDKRWTSDDCDVKAKYICERAPIKCLDGWEVNAASGTCIKFHFEAQTWDDAREVCKKEHGDLVKIVSLEMNTYISDEVEENGWDQAWTGLHDAQQDGEFFWRDETTILTYYGWASDKPDNMDLNGISTGTDCAILDVSENGNGTWSNVKCSNTYKFICERHSGDPEDFPITTQATIPATDDNSIISDKVTSGGKNKLSTSTIVIIVVTLIVGISLVISLSVYRIRVVQENKKNAIEKDVKYVNNAIAMMDS